MPENYRLSLKIYGTVREISQNSAHYGNTWQTIEKRIVDRVVLLIEI